MLNIYTSESKIKGGKEYIKYNDSFFLLNTITEGITEDDKNFIRRIDKAEIIEYMGKDTDTIRTPYGVTGIENLSTGCKTALNILHHREKVFECAECGPNVQRMLSVYFYRKEIDVDIVYKGECFHVGKGATVRMNEDRLIGSTVEYMSIKNRTEE
jgi:hypothetical protein